MNLGHGNRSAIVTTFIVFLAVLLLIIAIRWPLYRGPGVLLGWNSDAAIYGLIARAMLEEKRPIFLFWAQDYLGTLTSMWAVLASLFTGGVGPLALRIGTALQLAAALTLFWSVFRRMWGWAVAGLAMIWLAAGPKFFFDLSYAPLSAEQMLFVGAIILWYVTRAPFERTGQWFVLGALAALGWWAHRGTIFVVVPAVVAIVWCDRSWRDTRRALAATAALAAGLACGLVPLMLGRREINQRLYEPVTRLWSLDHLFSRIEETVRVDLWRFLGVENSLLGWICGALILILIVAGLRGTRAGRSEIAVLGTVVVSFGFWIISTQAYSGATRYLILALPVVCALAARGVVVLWRTGRAIAQILGVVASVLITFNLYSERIHDVREIAAAHREQYEHWPGGFDPRPALAELERGRYAVCYADFWIAYKLELLSATDVRFIPYRSVNRTQARSLQLIDAPGPKCFVANDGTVQRLTAQQESQFRAETVAAVGRSRPPLRSRS